MKIRTQIALAFLFLAIVPMAAIVLYSYVSSLDTLREAAEAEAESLTADMEARMGEVRASIRRRVERVGALPFRTWAQVNESDAEREAIYDSVVAELGEAAPLVERFEFFPEHAGPPPVLPGAREAPPAPPSAPIVIDMTAMLKSVAQGLEKLDPESLPDDAKKELIEQARLGLEFVHGKAQQFNQAAARVIEIRTDPEATEAELEELSMLAGAAAAAAAAENDAPGTSYRLSFNREVEVPVYEDGAVVGAIRAQVKNEELLRRVLERTRRQSGEIPFAIDGDGLLHAASDQDREALTGIGLEDRIDPGVLAGRRVFDGWIVVAGVDEASGLTFGIARPMQESLSEMRTTAARNFGFGTGLIGLALLGVVPLSRRMTHGLHLVTEGAERLASGDLATRVPLRSRSEIGQLARAFNDMAEDLEENQKRLLASERLQAEFDRKSEELEEARRFQLSLLPKTLPDHPAFEVAAVMKTATEVGGDYYDFRTTAGGSLTVAIGDATGHGAKAGTMVTVVKSLFSGYPPEGDLAMFQANAAAAIKRMELGRMSMALTVARLGDGKLILSAAGMPPAFVRRAATGAIEEIAIQGMPLGSLDFAYREHTVALDSGDLVLLMSDGFPELPNRDGDVLGYERARECFAEGGTDPQGLVRHLLTAADRWAGATAPADDITFVAIRVR